MSGKNLNEYNFFLGIYQKEEIPEVKFKQVSKLKEVNYPSIHYENHNSLFLIKILSISTQKTKRNM